MKHELKINRFDGGISNDLRTADSTKSGMVRHFDNFTYKHKLVPPYAFAALTYEDKTKKIAKFLYAPTADGGSTYRLWGLGGFSAGPLTDYVEIYYYSTSSGWIQSGGNLSGGISSRNTSVFFYYKGYIYMWVAGASSATNGVLSRCAVNQSGFTDAYRDDADSRYTSIAEPVHHPSDDVAYFFTDNRVHSLNNATWTSNVLTLPTDLKITCACPYGDYLAIGCAPLDAAQLGQRSVVFLWDRDSSITTLSQRIDFGEGALVHLACLDGKLIGVVNFFVERAIIKQASGNSSIILNEIISDSSDITLPSTRAVKNNRLYFPLTATLNGDARRGIWSVDGSGRAIVALVENAVESAATKTYQSIYLLGDNWLTVHSNDFSTSLLGSSTPTGGSRTYYAVNVSLWETPILNGGDSSQKKKLVSVTVDFEPLPSAGSVTLKYRKNEETSWTTIFTDSTRYDISHEAINIESSSATLSQFKEIQFQVNSFGGAVITGLKVKWEDVPDSKA